MCGRYALALVRYASTMHILPANSLQRPSQVRAYLENENMPIYEAPDDDGDRAPRQSYNFAPGYHGIVYRADTPDWGAGRQHKKGEGETGDEPAAENEGETAEPQEVRYKLQSMRWGLIPLFVEFHPLITRERACVSKARLPSS
jgi:SOS response associated peptidase (SRAP)